MQQWVLAVVACLLALGVILWLLRRHGGRLPIRGLPGRRVRVIERTSVTRDVHLVVVEYGGRRMLLSVSQGASTCLRDEAIAADAPVAVGGER